MVQTINPINDLSEEYKYLDSELKLWISFNLFDVQSENSEHNFKSKTTNNNYEELFKRFLKFLNKKGIKDFKVTVRNQYNEKLLLNVNPSFNFRN